MKNPLSEWIVPFLTKADYLLKSNHLLNNNQSVFLKDSKSSILFTYKKFLIKLILSEEIKNTNTAIANLLEVNVSFVKTALAKEYPNIPEKIKEELLLLKVTIQKHYVDITIQKYIFIQIKDIRNNSIISSILENINNQNVSLLTDRYLERLNNKKTCYELILSKELTKPAHLILKRFIPIIKSKDLKPII